ncbi:hypothetical protein HB662_19770 [Roseomonas frigidaquae]|uniref:VapC45 PIN like domain-containing protein n=1 Tax=Falsiroseomonas frigidaquae TaxID=487318 RepID=A0ABX1F3T2_9PROT|nr:hypothetical protein [Falsiroseomonas frigidaquae]NKE47028.1 hypothetical protein [Falsiroseomonas frigidaquae]
MRIVIDACLPPWLVECLTPIAEPCGCRVEHVTRLYGQGCKDPDWIGRLTSEGGALFITHDRQMRRRPLEIQALLASSCVGIVLAPGWQDDDDHVLVARLLLHWPLILEAAKETPPQLRELGWSLKMKPPRNWRGWDKIAGRLTQHRPRGPHPKE